MKTAEVVRTQVADKPAGSFIRPSDLPGSRTAVLTALSRLHANGELVRIRNGLYWKGLHSRFGPGRPSLLDAAVKAAGDKGVGPARWSATQTLGLSTQIPAIPEVAVTGTAPVIAGVCFYRRSNAERRDLSFIEIALIEVLREFPRFCEVDIESVARTIRRLAEKGELDMSSVERVASFEHSPSLRRNLESVRAFLGDDLKMVEA